MRWIAHDLADGDAVASEVVTAEEYEVVFAEEFARLSAIHGKTVPLAALDAAVLARFMDSYREHYGGRG